MTPVPLSQRNHGRQMSVDEEAFGDVKARVKMLEKNWDRIDQRFVTIDEKLGQIKSSLDEAKGGKKVLMWVAGGSGVMGALASKLAVIMGFLPR